MGRRIRCFAGNGFAGRRDRRLCATSRDRLVRAEPHARPDTGTSRRDYRFITQARRSGMSEISRNTNSGLSRRHLARLTMGLGASVLLPSSTLAETEAGPLMTRPIPSSGEALPAVGLGTAYVFDRADETTVSAAQRVVEALVT